MLGYLGKALGRWVRMWLGPIFLALGVWNEVWKHAPASWLNPGSIPNEISIGPYVLNLWFLLAILAFILAQYLVYRDAVKDAGSAAAGLRQHLVKAEEERDLALADIGDREQRSERRREVREGLASLYADGDQAWNAASMDHQLWEHEEAERTAALRYNQSPPPSNVTYQSYKVVGAWLAKAEDFLRSTPELGASYASVFKAQEPELLGKDTEKGLPSLIGGTGTRAQREMRLVRLKQQKLLDFLQDFKD